MEVASVTFVLFITLNQLVRGVPDTIFFNIGFLEGMVPVVGIFEIFGVVLE
jgi:hypothetical protein